MTDGVSGQATCEKQVEAEVGKLFDDGIDTGTPDPTGQQPSAHVDEIRRPEGVVHAIACPPQLVVSGDHRAHLVDVGDPEFRCVR
jgi:hypothetical protein